MALNSNSKAPEVKREQSRQICGGSTILTDSIRIKKDQRKPIIKRIILWHLEMGMNMEKLLVC